METAFIESPLGITKIVGNENGISEISVLSEDDSRAKLEQAKQITTKIPKNLKECVSQLQDYFNGKRNHFDFKINPQGTEF